MKPPRRNTRGSAQRHVRRKSAALLSGAEEQTARAISACAQFEDKIRIQDTAGLLATRGADWILFFGAARKKSTGRRLMEGFHAPATAYFSVYTGAKHHHGGREEADS